ncbi:MAG: DUF4838 domain-containing protein [Bryobacteraceae bacterium]
MKTISWLLLTCLPLGAVTLVKNGRSDHSICLAPDASPSERRAAEELQRFIAGMSGARLPLLDKCGGRGPFVRVGGGGAFGPEEYRLRTSGRDLLIEGGHLRGTMYGAYALLEKLGCRWFTVDVSRIPKLPTIEIGPLDETGKPAFEYREPYFTEAFDKDWAARNRTNGAFSKLDESTGGKVEYFPFVHSFESLIPPQQYFKDHPEYFSLIDGARRAEKTQLCLTNPDVLRLTVARVREWIAEHPTAKIISVSQNDWEGWCECDRCKRVEQEEGGQHSGPMLRFVNAVAAEIEKTNPDKLIDTLAYWYSENPPAKVRPRPNVRIRLCPIGVCVAHPYELCPRSTYFVKNLKAWSAITNQLYIWHYNTDFAHYLAPFPDFDELAADMPLYQRNGVVGVFLEGAYPPGGGSENGELRSYVMARLLWNPQTDVNRDIAEFVNAVYGRAAQPMREYLDLLQREVRLPPSGLGQHLWVHSIPSYSADFLPRAKAIFERALQAAEDSSVRRRVAKARLPLEYMEMTAARQYVIDGDLYSPRDLAKWKTRFSEFLASMRSFGITSIREGRTLEEDEKWAAAMTSYRLTWLENDKWRVAVAPELAGRVVRMTDRKIGRELLHVPWPGEALTPNTGGQVVQAYPDFPLRPWDVEWKSVSASPTEVVLEGVCTNGVKMERRIRLDGDWVRTEAWAENGGQDPLDVVLQTRAELEPADIDRAGVSYRATGGSEVNRLLIAPAELPNGSETLVNADVPDGEWHSVGVVNRFPRELAERTTVSWTPKNGPKVTLGVWSKKVKLAPGERVRVAADYRSE